MLQVWYWVATSLSVENAVPDVQFCQFTSKSLIGVETSSNAVLILSQHHYTSRPNYVTCFKIITLALQFAILIEFVFTINVAPCIGVRALLDLGGGGGAVTLLPEKNYHTLPESMCCRNALKSQ